MHTTIETRNWTFEMVRVADLKIDPTYHDPARFNARRAELIGHSWDSNKVGVIEVSQRSNGALITIDGQHRIGGARIAGVEYLPAKVWHDLTVKDEAQIYLGRSDAVRLNALQQFRARLIAEEPQALSIQAVLNEHGVKLISKGKFTAGSTKAIQTIYRLHSVGILAATLTIARYTWPEDNHSLDSIPLQGIGSFLLVYADHPRLDRERLQRKLSEQSASWLIRAAKDLAALGKFGTGGVAHSGSGTVLGYSSPRRAVLARYNHRLSNPLPDATMSDLRAIGDGRNPWAAA